jgi:hypothetical protein
LVSKGKFLSYSGYYLPKEMANGIPIGYWYLKRRLIDHFIESGEDYSFSKEADFKVRGKLIHIWHDIDPKKILLLCKKADSIIIFPDELGKEEFRSKAGKYDPAWMKVHLELQYGGVYCQTIDEFIGRGSNGKN